jgi:hypothetical protein
MSTFLTLNNWYIMPEATDPYRAPEMRRMVLHGEMHDGFTFPFRTWYEDLVLENEELGQFGSVSCNSFYLGNPKDDYEEVFSDARARVIAQFKGMK